MDHQVYQSLYERVAIKLQAWLDAGLSLFPNAVVALVTLAFFWAFAKLVGLLVERTLARMRTEDAASRLIATLVRLIVLGAGGAVALGVLNLDRAAASLLAGAGIAGLALGFAFQDLAANLISGVGLAIRREHPFKTGDLIESNGFLGRVRHVDLRTSTLETFDGKFVIIPNKQIYQGIVVNHSTSGRRRVELEVGVSYHENLERVRAITLEALNSILVRLPDPPKVFFKNFGDSSINFFCFYWVEYHSEADFLNARNAAVIAIKKAFDHHGVTIPFPIRTLDFGIKGGQTLKQQLGETTNLAQLPVKSEG